MAGEVAERSKPQKGKGLRRPKRRVAIKLDMTPMVDDVECSRLYGVHPLSVDIKL